MRNHGKSMKINENQWKFNEKSIKNNENQSGIEFFSTLIVSQMSILMKIVCFSDDFVWFWMDFGRIWWVLNGFWMILYEKSMEIIENQWKSLKIIAPSSFSALTGSQMLFLITIMRLYDLGWIWDGFWWILYGFRWIWDGKSIKTNG